MVPTGTGQGTGGEHRCSPWPTRSQVTRKVLVSQSPGTGHGPDDRPWARGQGPGDRPWARAGGVTGRAGRSAGQSPPRMSGLLVALSSRTFGALSAGALLDPRQGLMGSTSEDHAAQCQGGQKLWALAGLRALLQLQPFSCQAGLREMGPWKPKM